MIDIGVPEAHDLAEPLRDLRAAVSASNRKVVPSGPLHTAASEDIRAGRRGGLPFDSLIGDVVTGCLPASTACYGSCFAAFGAFRAGFDFGRRVPNRLDEELLRADIAALPAEQAYLRCGWNSDPSWDWPMIARLGEIVSESGRMLILITKVFRPLPEQSRDRMIAAGVELRVSISAFDAPRQLERRIETMTAYRDAGGIAVPLVMTTRFAEPALNVRQDAIVARVVQLDLPGAENSLRFGVDSDIVAKLDRRQLRPVAISGDLWCGRLYTDALPIPTTTSIPANYRGLSSGFRSRIGALELARLFHEPVRTHVEVIVGAPLPKPTQCGVSRAWAVQMEETA